MCLRTPGLSLREGINNLTQCFTIFFLVIPLRPFQTFCFPHPHKVLIFHTYHTSVYIFMYICALYKKRVRFISPLRDNILPTENAWNLTLFFLHFFMWLYHSELDYSHQDSKSIRPRNKITLKRGWLNGDSGSARGPQSHQPVNKA